KSALLILCAVAVLTASVFAAGSGTGSAVYTDTTVFTDGFTYEKAVSYNASGSRVETNLIDIAAESSVHPITLACDTIYGGLTVTQMIAYAESLDYDVLGAVNSDFYYVSTRVPLGMVVEDGIYKSSPDGINALAMSDEGSFVSESPSVTVTLTNETGERAGQSISTMRLNKSRGSKGMFIYTEHFSTVSTRTSTDGWMVRLKILEGELTVQGEMKLEVTELYQGNQAQKIGIGNIILTAETAAGLKEQFEKFQVGDIVTLTTRCSDERLADADWVTGCGNILALNGNINAPEKWDSAILGQNPRTAVGIRDDGSMVFYTVDGRSKLSAGATLMQLAEDMLDKGCTTVVNMDGGGSTTLALRNPQTGKHEVINSPSDGSARRCAGYILFVTESAEDSHRLFLGEDGQYILTGAVLPLSSYAADGALHPYACEQTVITPTKGIVRGVRYTAPLAPCVDILSLESGSISGQGELHIISAADTLAIKNSATGNEVTALSLNTGDNVNLSVSALKYGRGVCISGTQTKFSCSPDIGSISTDGTFTANGTARQGSITIEAAGISTTIPVSVNFVFNDINSHWAKSSIEALYHMGIVGGVSPDRFAPDLNMKRGDFVLMLYRACGEPETSAKTSFADVPADSYYATAIAWAQEMDIVHGNSDGTFTPKDALTREQAFTLVYRALPLLKINTPEPDTSLLAQFSDCNEVSDYAKNAMSALIELGIVSGSGGKLIPKDTLTRAQMAKLLHYCLQK
ncbi:MAG: S-layer homology domain-containing protein, partial [Oscillospiraceae bacterium]|nr:S-layer homology domain-containing protein [Oscillospiraceae bacterium]